MKLKSLFIYFSMFIVHCSLYAGPPFNTDDPVPVSFRHWELYISSIDNFNRNISMGTLPHIEINYGAIPDIQLHIAFPFNFIKPYEGNYQYGYGNTELGIKYRFIKEDDNSPQVSVFPSVELPSNKNNVISNNKLQVYLPIWLQKSWGKLTTYSGGGYWFNPGTGNKNWFFAGWEVQCDINKTFTPGCEIFYHTAQTEGDKSKIGINAGGFINFSNKFHFIFSVGYTFNHTSSVISYGGALWTL